MHTPSSVLYEYIYTNYIWHQIIQASNVHHGFGEALASLVLHPERRQGPASTRKSSKMSPRHRLAVTAAPRPVASASPHAGQPPFLVFVIDAATTGTLR